MPDTSYLITLMTILEDINMALQEKNKEDALYLMLTKYEEKLDKAMKMQDSQELHTPL